MTWRKKKKWNIDEINFHYLWKAICKINKKKNYINGLHVYDIMDIINKYWTFDSVFDIYEAKKILQIFEGMGMIYEDKNNRAEVNGKWVSMYFLVNKQKTYD